MKWKSRARKRATKSAVKQPAKVAPMIVVQPPSPEEIAKWKEWEKLTKINQYDAKHMELLKLDPDGQRFKNVVDAIFSFIWEDDWFYNNTSYKFKHSYLSRISLLSTIVCRHLQTLARNDNNDAIKTLAYITISLTETLTELLQFKSSAAQRNELLIKELKAKFDGAPFMVTTDVFELLKGEAKEIPYWPMLRFKNAAANSKKQFQRIADELELGKECPLNVSERANYSLETPINAFVWRCLRHFQHVHGYIRRNIGSISYKDMPKRRLKTFDEILEEIVFQERPASPGRRPVIVHGMIKKDDMPIYKASYALPPLTKSTAKEWAEKAIMPYVDSKYPDYSKAPELSEILKSVAGKTRGVQRQRIRKDIIRALTSMARPKDMA